MLVLSVVLAACAVTLFATSESYSITNLPDFSNIMKQSSGYTTITASGEGSMTLEPDSIVMVLTINNPPMDLPNALEKYEQNISDVSSELEIKLAGFDDVSVSYIQTSFDGNNFRYGGSGNTSDSYVAYMSFPIKVDMNKYQTISQDITKLGLRIDDIRISQVPIKDPNVMDVKNPVSIDVSIPYGTSVPECELLSECYLPARITVDTGNEVVWSNDDEAAHTVTSGTPDNGPDGLFDSGLFMAGTTFSHTFESSGTFDYFCMVHPWMTGSISVIGDGNNSDLGYMLEATINVRLETKPDTLENTLSTYTKSLDDLSALLKEHNVTGEIPRSTVNINPSYYDRGSFDSYQTYGRWTVKTTLENLNDVNGILSKYGGIERLYMSHSKSSIDAARHELTQMALDDARKNVLSIIEPMNLEIKGIKGIKINQDLNDNQNRQMLYNGVLILYDDWNNMRDGNISVIVSVEFEVGQ